MAAREYEVRENGLFLGRVMGINEDDAEKTARGRYNITGRLELHTDNPPRKRKPRKR